MWRATTSEITAGRRYEIFEQQSPMRCRQLFERLLSDNDFTDWFSATLAAFGSEACYFEMPPLTCDTLSRTAEFVLMDAPTLARMKPEPEAFASHFRSCPEDSIVVFPNLGGDATLVVPCPLGPDEIYPHLAAFLRGATLDQVRALWRATAETLLARLGNAPTWLSTAGIGVAWLHIRLDSRPKYYRYGPYT